MPLLDEIRDFLSTPTVPAPTYGSDYESYVDELALQHPNVPSEVVKKLIQKESTWKPNATVYTGKEKYGMARGLGQFIDETAQRYIPEWKSPADSYDPQRNIQGIFNYLDDLVNREGSIDEALKTYHGRGTDILGTTSEDYSRDILADIPLAPGKKEPVNLADIRTFLGGKKEAVKEPEKIVEAPAEKYLPEIEGAPAGTTGITLPEIRTEEEMAQVPTEAPILKGKKIEGFKTIKEVPFEKKEKGFFGNVAEEAKKFQIARQEEHDELMNRGAFLQKARDRFEQQDQKPPNWADPKRMRKEDKFAYNYFTHMTKFEPATAALSAYAGGMVPFSQGLKSKIQKTAEEKFPKVAAVSRLGGVITGAVIGGNVFSKGLSKVPFIKDSPNLLSGLTRMSTAGVVSAGQQQWKDNFKESMKNTLVGVGAGAVSIIPEIIGPANAWQLALQPLADVIYDAAIAKGTGKKILSKEFVKENALNWFIGFGFALRDVASGAEFKATQKTQREELKGWLKGKKNIEVKIPEGFELVEGRLIHKGAGKKIEEAVEKEVSTETPKEKALRIEKAKAREAGEKAPPIAKGEEPIVIGHKEGVFKAEDVTLPTPEAPIPPKAEPVAEKVVSPPKKEGKLPTPEEIEAKKPVTPQPAALKIGQKKEPVIKEISKMNEKEILNEIKTLESEEEAAIRSYGEKQDIELQETEFASKLRQEAFGEKRTVIRKGKVVETTGLEKGLSKDDWSALTGDSTAPRSAKVNKKLQTIADAWNTARDEGPGATALDVPPERLLQSNDNWAPDDVANVLSRGMNKKDFADFKKQRELDIEKTGEEGEIAFEELARRREAIEGRIKEIKKLPPGAELFKTPKTDPLLGSEKGAIDFSTPSKTTSPVKNLMKGFKKFFTAPGLLPQKVFEAKVEKEGWYRAEMREVEDNLKDYERAVNQAYKKELTDIERYKLDAALKGEYDVTKLPEEVRQPIKVMREHIDAMSQRLIDSGMVEGDLEGVIAENKGFYATRSYRVHDDPNWSKKVPEEVRNKAKALLRQDLETSNIDIQTKMDNLQGRKSDLISLQRRPDKATVVEERLLRLKTETEDVVAKNNKVIDRKIAIIKNRMQANRDKLQAQRQKVNKKKTEVWRERPVTEQTKKALEKRKKIIEHNIEKLEEENEVTDDIISQMDEMQGDLAKTIEDILKHPTRLQDLGAVMVSFNSRVENVTGLITKSKIAEGAEIIKQVTSIKKQAQRAISKINERKTKIWREVGEDVDIGAKSTEEKIKNIDTEIDELNKEITEVSEETINGLIGELLYKENAPVGIVSRGSKLGAKNLSILKKRKGIAPEIRALWGEYKEADVNYARSVSKMANLVSNNDFLVKSLEAGKNDFFFDKPKGDYHVKISAEGSKVLEPLDGKYTTPEIKEAFEKLVEVENNPAWLKWWMRAIAIPKYSKTVASPMTHIRNFTANTMFAVANAHYNIKKMPQAMAGLIKDSKAFRARRRRMLELGVVGESARAGELRAVLKEANLGGLDYIVGSKYKKTLKRVGRIPEKLYAAEDDVWKWYAFENEFARYKKVYPDKPAAELEKDVAKIIRNTYPTYSQVPLAIQKLRRFPILGTFVSFPWEVVRTGVNTIKLAKTELANPKTRAIGAQRLAGLTAATTLSGGLAMASRFLTGVSKKEEENMRHFVAPWDANQQLFHLGKRGTGEYQYVNVGYTDPYSYVKAPLIAFMRGENWQEKLAMSAGEAFEPFLSEDIFTQKILDLARNQKKSGGKVWNPQDTGEGIATDIVKHFMDALEPGAVSSGRRIYKGVIRKEGAAGHPYNVKDEVTALMSGFRINRMDVSRALPYKVFEFKRNNIEAARLERKKTIEAGFAAKMKNYREMHEYAARAVNLGLTPSDVKSILRNSGLSKPQANSIMTGTYTQFLTDQYNKKIREKK